MGKETKEASNAKDKEASIVPVNQNIEVFDQRIRNVEKIVDAFQDVSNKLFDLMNGYLGSKAENDKRQIGVDDVQHKRAAGVLVYAMTILFVLCFTALVTRQFDLVRFFIESSLAIAAGSGITALFKSTSRRKKSSGE
jgi:hypothetical protein